MTADLLDAPPAVVEPDAPVDEGVTCEECLEDHPADSLRFDDRSELRLCLDCLYAVQLRADDDRAYSDYRRGY